jgi:hypothetical protein
MAYGCTSASASATGKSRASPPQYKSCAQEEHAPFTRTVLSMRDKLTMPLEFNALHYGIPGVTDPIRKKLDSITCCRERSFHLLMDIGKLLGHTFFKGKIRVEHGLIKLAR